MKISKPKIEKWEALSREIVFEKYDKKIEKVRFRLPSGQEDDFYLKAEKDNVCIFALTKGKKVIAVKQYRPGPDKVLIELPGGTVDINETPIETARREFLEETGYRGKMKLVVKSYDCAYSTINRYCYVATDCEKVKQQELDDTEFAEVMLISLQGFRKLLRDGQMADVEVGYLGLDYLGLL